MCEVVGCGVLFLALSPLGVHRLQVTFLFQSELPLYGGTQAMFELLRCLTDGHALGNAVECTLSMCFWWPAHRKFAIENPFGHE